MSRLKLLVCLTTASICSLIFAATAAAMTFTVNTSAEGNDIVQGDGVCQVFMAPGVCPLRAAIEEANAFAGPDMVDFSVPGPFKLIGPVIVNQSVIIDGNGSGVAGTVVEPNVPDSHRLFETNAAVTFKDLRLREGGLANGQSGAALNLHHDTTLDNVTVTSNQITGSGTFAGAGIRLDQPARTLTLSNSTVSDNTISTGANLAAGGGIYSAGALNLTDSTVSGNGLTSTGQVQGAGIYADGVFSIVRSAITGNTIAAGGASPKGAGLYAATLGFGGTTIANSTFSGNSAGDGSGGGLANNANGAVTIDGSTFASNSGTAGGADIYAESAATVTVRNTILASTASPPCLQITPNTIVSGTPGNNIDIGTSCGFGTMNGNKQNTDPLLAPLTLNPPGTTETRAITSSSPAFNAATADCGGLSTDQRGVLRPQPAGGVCDIGAFEVEYHTLTVTATGPGTVAGTGISCPGDCSETKLGGSTIALTATAGSGSSFSGWSGACAGTGPCNVSLDVDRAVTATFTTPPKKKCKKGRKLKKGKCVKKRKPKKK